MPADDFRAYDARELGADGYPLAWHATIKHEVREQAGYRCVRCGHPYIGGEGEWSTCDSQCTHGGPIRWRVVGGTVDWKVDTTSRSVQDFFCLPRPQQWVVEGQWRILTVHHLDGDKANCRWWNLMAACQRCHLQIQGKVQMARVWPWEHSEWMKPYAAGFYAHSYLGLDLSRGEVVERLDELLGLERLA
jgi:hypothetical protein